MDRATKSGLTANDIKSAELYGVVTKAIGEDAPLSDSVIRQRIYAAEDFYERYCQMSLQPRRVFSTPQTRVAGNVATSLIVTDFNAVEPPGEGYASYGGDLADPAYDYPRDLWDFERWGLLRLRNRPIRSITQVVFTWAGSIAVWKVPQPWIQWDAKGGTLNLVPTTGPAILVTFSAFLLSVVAGGRGLPHSIIVDYEVGFTADELQADHQDLLAGIRLRALLLLGGIISNTVTGGTQSDSLALDGLSHSRGFGGKYGAYSGAIQLAMDHEREIRENWRAKEKGLTFAVL
jgi:hypothetical protein